jgi:transposase-like protein
LYLTFKLSSRDLVQMMAERASRPLVSLYRAVDTSGRTVDFLLSRRRDIAAAKRFFSRATGQHGVPRVITLDGHARLASGGRQTERGWNATAPRTGAILQAFEQRGRARSSPDKAANPADARIQQRR